MRYVNIALIVLITAAILLFKFQNLSSVTVSLLGMSMTLPMSVWTFLVYLLGMVSGSALVSAYRKLYKGSKATA
jgi:lipopolysaccharide assembly protein A